MNYHDAKKQIEKSKAPSNYLVFEFSYDHFVVLPHKDGLTLLSALEHAEQLQKGYSAKTQIVGIKKDIKITPMSHNEYVKHKIAALLDVSYEDLDQMQKLEEAS